MFKNLIKHITLNSPTLPPLTALGYEYIWASNGIFLRAENRFAHVLIPIVPAPQLTVRGLYPLAPSVKLKMLKMPICLLSDVYADARKSSTSNGPLNEALYRFHVDGQTIRVVRPKQDTSPTHVHTVGDGGPDVILEIHSHGNMKAYWSATDNTDEKGFRFYAVVGRLDSSMPQIRLRLGVYGYHYQISQDTLFTNADLSPFVNCHEEKIQS